MRFKAFTCIILTALFCAATPAQVAPSMLRRAESPIKIGAGFSDFKTSFGNGTEKGGTLWIDYYPSGVPQFLNGIGLEVEARDLSLAPSVTLPGERIDEAQGGVIYSWHHFRSFHPYAKALIGVGNFDYKLGKNGVRSHDTRTIRVFGGGAEYSFSGGFGARVEYEYQFWPDFWHFSSTPGSLTPNGVTVGMVYRFGSSGK